MVDSNFNRRTFLKASGRKLESKDRDLLKKYAKAVDDRYCRIGCSICLASRPNRVAIHDIMRFGMYYENYSERNRAMLDYARMDEKRRARACASCSEVCASACPHELSIRERLIRFDRMLRYT